MGNFSRDTYDLNKKKHYVNVRKQKDIPFVDSDWNEMDDIRKYEFQNFIKNFIGDGVSDDDGFLIAPVNNASNDFLIKKGYCLVNGRIVINENDVKYSDQHLQVLKAPQNQARIDTVYLDVWEREVGSNEDPDLIDPGIAIETCVRIKREWFVRVGEGIEGSGGPSILPSPPDGHDFYILATLTRNPNEATISSNNITDKRFKGLNLEEIARSGDLPVSKFKNVFVTGTIGIGIPSPSEKLEVSGTVKAENLEVNGTVKASKFVGDGSDLTGIKAGQWTDVADGISYAGNVDVKATRIKLGLEKDGGGQLHLSHDPNDNMIYLEAYDSNGNNSSSKLVLSGAGSKNVPSIELRADNTFFNGNVGIGPLTPSEKLEVNGTVKASKFVGDGSGLTGIKAGQWTDIEGGIFYGGNVGIGTTNPLPNAKLNLQGGGLNIGGSKNLDAAIHIKSSFGGFDRLLQMSPTGASKPGLNLVASIDANSREQWWAWGVDTDNKWKIRPGTGFAGSTGLSIDSSGNVGIGTDKPDGKLDVKGDIRAGNSDIYFTKVDHNHTGIGNTSGYAAIENAANYDALMILGRAGTQKGRYVRLWDYLQVNGGMDITGNVGIGTMTPRTPLHVLGRISTGADFTSAGAITFFPPDGFAWFHIDNGPVGRPIGRLRISHGNQPGASELMSILQNGNVGIGTVNPGSKLTVAGSIAGGETKTGWVLGAGAWGPDTWLRLTTTQGGSNYHDLAINHLWAAGNTRFDLAEVTPIKDEDQLEQGDVVVIDEEDGLRVKRSTKSNDTSVYGIVSSYETAAMVIGGAGPETVINESGKLPIALIGRVKAKVSAEGGAIQVGDLLTTSSTPGHLMKCDDMSKGAGAIAGKALEALKNGKGMITVLVTLQ